jgi:hypothetical protein
MPPGPAFLGFMPLKSDISTLCAGRRAELAINTANRNVFLIIMTIRLTPVI